jgi:hypothetical protein
VLCRSETVIDLSMRVPRLGLAALAAAAALGLSSPVALAAPSGTLKTVTYLGYSFSVPASWPVIRTTSTSATCVRFDQHAIYLGQPGQNQDCPSGLLGTTEALVVQPSSAPGSSSSQDQASRTITVLSPRIEVTATYDTDRALVTQILASASLPAPAASTGPAGIAAGPAVNAAPLAPAGAAAVPTSATSYTGRGFDACAAPSSAYMSAWRGASPYRAVGIYIGGADRACSQPNLTASWVAQQAAAGWHFLPTYAGAQAEFSQLTSPASQGAAAAQDAVTQAAALGFGPGTPVYYDMEAYPAAQKSNVLTFLSAWTTQLHAEGYKSGVYSSSSSGITDLADNLRAYAMPDVIWDALWNGDANTADAAIPAADWAAHQRAHQYSGGADASYGGDTIDIDQDYLDVDLTPSPADPAQPALVTRAGTVSDFVIGSGRNLYAYDQQSPGGGFARPKRLTSGGGLTGTPVAVQAANGTVWVVTRTTDGSVRVIWQSAAGGAFNHSATLSGRITGNPAAIMTSGDTAALYAVGANGKLYTWTQASPGGSFSGPSRLTVTGGLTGTPVAVQAANGAISVYARTTDGSIRAKWQSAPGRPLSYAATLSGHIRGPGPAAVVTENDTVALYAIGTNGELYTWTQASLGGPFSRPAELTVNGGLTGPPVAVQNSGGAVTIFARTVHRLVRAKWQSVAGGPFSASANLGGQVTPGMAALVVGDDAVSLYVTGINGRQYSSSQATAGGAFGGWRSV